MRIPLAIDWLEPTDTSLADPWVGLIATLLAVDDGQHRHVAVVLFEIGSWVGEARYRTCLDSGQLPGAR